MVLTATGQGAALVAGSAGGNMAKKPTAMETVVVRRAFFFQGNVCRPGQSVSLPAPFAREVVAANKAILIGPPSPPELSPEREAHPTQSKASTRFGRGGTPPETKPAK